jgi:hypothetical protein
VRRRLIAALVVLIGLVAVGLVLRRARAPQDDRVWQTPSPTVVAVVPASPTPLASPAPPRLEGVVPRSPTPVFPATPPASPAVPSPTPDARARPSAPDWLQTTGREFVDTAGRTVVLRGFVTLTNDSEGQPVVYTLDDYRRMRQLGANYQSIRLGAGALGAWPGTAGAPQYLDRLAGMVAMAKQVGMYSTFKLTVYDLRGFTRGGWEALWADRHGEQVALIAGWRRIWERFRDEPAVVGYDLLNEPEPGDLGVSTETFIADYLNPFYRRVIDDLRRTDARHLAFFQPPFGSPPYRAPLQRPGVVYTPHFYPNLPNYLRRGDFSTSAYAPELQRFLSEASLHQAPLFIGEYGMPWSPRNDGDAPRERQYQQLERTASALFDQHRLGFSRPWFADDRAGVRLGGLDLNWALIRGTAGLRGPERTFITDIIARPYPQRVAGTLEAFGFDFDGRTFTLRYHSRQRLGRTEVYVPQRRHYPAGFQVRHSGGAVLRSDPASPTGLRLASGPTGSPTGAFTWHETDQVLVIQEWQDAETTLEIVP